MQRFVSNRMEILAANMAAHLMEDPSDPMEPGVVVVQSQGMERWLSMELARWAGVCANMMFLFPGSLMERCLLPKTGEEGARSWEKASLRWFLYRVLQKLPDDKDFRPLVFYTKRDPLRTLQLADLLAELFDEYVLFRPEKILAWEKGRENHFQAKLWRILKKEIPSPHRVDLVQAFHSQEGGNLFIPKQISIFGVSALPPLYLSFLEKLGEDAVIRWYLLDPCREYWGDIFSRKKNIFLEYAEESRPDRDEKEKGHPLLGSFGKTGRAFLGELAAMGGSEDRVFAAPGEGSLLHRIQSGIGSLDNDELKALFDTPLSSSDDSIRIHACHGPMREMEVLRDEILRLLSQGNPPNPREILVMFPDIDAYAPYVEAVFDRPLPDGGRLLYRIADKNLLSENKNAFILIKILSLISSRFTASEVFDILEYPLVATRFGLTETDLEEVRSWVLDLRISWGLDGAFKALQNLPAAASGTWRHGLDRMVLGIAMEDVGVTEEDFLPYDPMGPDNARILSGFLSFMEKLVALYEESRTSRSMVSWAHFLQNFLNDFLDERQGLEGEFIAIRKVLDSLCEEARCVEEALPFSVFRFAFQERLSSEKSVSTFPGGGITFCSMVPMRCIPFPTVCLCGMNEKDFPRKQFRPAFDIMAMESKPGDRSRRDDDRYLFLETLLSARRRFWITYTGFKAEDHSMIPPSVLVEELLHSTGNRDTLLKKHPMQPFSPSLFMKKGKDEPASFSRENLDIARAIFTSHRKENFVFQDDGSRVLQSEKKKELFFSDLVSFFEDPAEFFLKRNLGFGSQRETKLFSDEELFSLNALDHYFLRLDFCENALEKGDNSSLWKRIALENRIPQGAGGKMSVRVASREGKILAGKILEINEPIDPSMKPVWLDMEEIRLIGEIPESGIGNEIFWRAGEIRPKDLLIAWLHFLFRKAAGLDTILYYIGTNKNKDHGWSGRVIFQEASDAKKHLCDLVRIYQKGNEHPLPFFPELSNIFIKKLFFSKNKSSKETILEKLKEVWEGGQAGRAACLIWQGKDPFDCQFEKLSEDIWLPVLQNISSFSLE